MNRWSMVLALLFGFQTSFLATDSLAAEPEVKQEAPKKEPAEATEEEGAVVEEEEEGTPRKPEGEEAGEEEVEGEEAEELEEEPLY